MSPAQKCAHLIGLGKDEWIGDDLGDIATGDGRRIDDGTRCSDLPTPRCVRAAEAARRSHDGTRQARKPMRRREEGKTAAGGGEVGAEDPPPALRPSRPRGGLRAGPAPLPTTCRSQLRRWKRRREVERAAVGVAIGAEDSRPAMRLPRRRAGPQASRALCCAAAPRPTTGRGQGRRARRRREKERTAAVGVAVGTEEPPPPLRLPRAAPEEALWGRGHSCGK